MSSKQATANIGLDEYPLLSKMSLVFDCSLGDLKSFTFGFLIEILHA